MVKPNILGLYKHCSMDVCIFIMLIFFNLLLMTL